MSLDLSSNGVTAKGAHFLFEALVKNQSLIDLDISSKSTGQLRNVVLGSNGYCSPLASLLAKNTFLMFLNL